MANKKYEVASPIRLEDGELKGVGSVVTLDTDDADTATFLDRKVIRLVPGQGSRAPEGADGPSDPADPGGAGSNNNPQDDPPGDPGNEGGGPSLAEAFGEENAEILDDAGYERVSEVVAASDEVLLAINGIGPQRLKRIREFGG